MLGRVRGDLLGEMKRNLTGLHTLFDERIKKMESKGSSNQPQSQIDQYMQR